MIAQLDKAVCFVVSPHTYVCICALTQFFDQYEEGNVQTNTIIIKYSTLRCVK